MIVRQWLPWTYKNGYTSDQRVVIMVGDGYTSGMRKIDRGQHPGETCKWFGGFHIDWT